MGIAESTIKRKIEKIKKANIKLDILEFNDCVGVYLEIDQLIEPQMRPRSGKFGNIYDPLKNYKKIFKEKVIKSLNELGYTFEMNENIYVHSEIKLMCEPPSNFSNIMKYNAINFHHNVKFNKKPDIDNCVKTIYDSLEKIFFFNDSQIVKESMEKLYSTEEKTIIKFQIFEQPNYKGKKFTKEDIELIKDEEIKNYLK